MLRIFVAITIVILVVLYLAGFNKNERRADLVFVTQGDVFTLDPQRMSWLVDMQAAYCLYEGLVRWNTVDFSIEPAGAESYDISDDKKTYTFHLRKDARWSNGAAVTAYDFQYAWMRLLTPDTSSDYSSFFFVIKGSKSFWDWRNKQLAEGRVISLEELAVEFNRRVGIQCIDNNTLVVTLEHPVPFFLDQVALAVCSPVYKPAVEGWNVNGDEYSSAIEFGWQNVTPPHMSQRKWVDVDAKTGRILQQYFWARPNTLIGNGPFILTQWRYKRDMFMSQNPHYHSPKKDGITSIQAVTIADANTAVLAFEGGEFDWLSGVHVDYLPDMLQQKIDGKRHNIHAFPTFGTDFFSFNCRPLLQNGATNPFHNSAIRRAFVYATDRDAIVKHATRLQEPTVTSIVPPRSLVGYGDVNGLSFDVDAATRELSSQGWVDRDGDGLVEDENGNHFPTIDLLYTTNTPRYKWMSIALRDQWKKHLGVTVELRGTDNKFFSTDLRSGNFMIARGRWYGDYGDPTTFLDIFKTDNGNNDRGFSNPDIDDALRRAEIEQNPTKRLSMLRDIEEKLFTEDVPMLVVCQLLQVYMYDPETVSGLTSHPRLVQHLWRVKISEEQVD